MISTTIILTGINPEVWSAPHVGKHGGTSSGKMKAYKDAIREALEDYDREPLVGELELHLFFWRALESGNTGKARRTTAKRADATNLQKATEDALQGIIFDNDQAVVHVETWIMEQEADTEPRIMITCRQIESGHRPNVAVPADLWVPPAHRTAPERPDFDVRDVF